MSVLIRFITLLPRLAEGAIFYYKKSAPITKQEVNF